MTKGHLFSTITNYMLLLTQTDLHTRIHLNFSRFPFFIWRPYLTSASAPAFGHCQLPISLAKGERDPTIYQWRWRDYLHLAIAKHPIETHDERVWLEFGRSNRK